MIQYQYAYSSRCITPTIPHSHPHHSSSPLFHLFIRHLPMSPIALVRCPCLVSLLSFIINLFVFSCISLVSLPSSDPSFFFHSLSLFPFSLYQFALCSCLFEFDSYSFAFTSNTRSFHFVSDFLPL